MTIPIRSINNSLRAYIAFYERIAPFSKFFHVGYFPDVTSDFGAVMCDFNNFYGTSYVCFYHSVETALSITPKSPHIGPRFRRDELKAIVKSRYDLLADDSLKARGKKICQYILSLKGIRALNDRP